MADPHVEAGPAERLRERVEGREALLRLGVWEVVTSGPVRRSRAARSARTRMTRLARLARSSRLTRRD